MHEPPKTDFQPRWYRNATAEVRNALADFSGSGSKPLNWPRIVTRILPSSGSSSLAARTVSEVIDLTQKLAHFAAYDAVRGLNPDFADMRSMGADVLSFSRLTIEPFEEGSFVIPARFESADFIPVEPNAKELEAGNITPEAISAESIASRFGSILDEIATGGATHTISTGALQTVQQLNRALKREVVAIEFATFDRREQQSSYRSIDHEFIERVDRVIQQRRPSNDQLESVEGTVTALDIEQGELRLSIRGQKQRVRGNFHTMLHPTLLESLGKRIRLFGSLSYKRDSMVSIQIQQAEVFDTE
ncbi:MAG: hypothetical protein WD049_05190 [Candidatus Paceibacterota bacterium]